MERLPRRRDAVWHGQRFNDGLQPNGRIVEIDWDEKEVIVEFYRNTGKDIDLETFSFDEIDGHYTSRYGGVWMLP